MRFAILGSRGYPSTYSGYETLVRELAPYLASRGHEVVVYSRRDHAQFRLPTSDLLDGVGRVWTPGTAGKSTSTLTHGFTSAVHLARHPTDAALVLNVANSLYLTLLRRSAVPVAVNVDGIEWQRGKWNALGKSLFRLGAGETARGADEVITDSRAIGVYWMRMFGRESVFIPYGAVVETPPATRLSELGLRPRTFVLSVARLVPENNIELLLAASELMPLNVPVVIVGDAPGRSRVRDELARRVEGNPRLRWLGHVTDQDLLRQLWGNCGAYWHGHSVGGTNPSLLQALGYGAPVVAFDTVFNREVLGDDGLLVGSDPGRLRDDLVHLLLDASARESVVKRGRDIVTERYRWPDVCAAYEKVLVSLASGSEGAK